ncbi:MAG: NTP transferase domain-containing protein [Lachnospiraceae bacterium]|nr:NTP transferase domain-containing protein [Lachnospiraceae bacterium]
MDFEYIVVQAGGKGTRLEHITKNKPKALAPINNLPMLFHLFKKYPDKKFLIIGDYKIDVLKKYLAAFAKVKYLVVDARGNTGTCSGIGKAVAKIPDNKAFMLIWSDLILPDDYNVPEEKGNYVGLSTDFKCRWRYEDNTFEEIPSVETGVAGFFIFENKDILKDVPDSGEFVRWLGEKGHTFKTTALSRTKEYGLLEEYNKLETSRCRPFNKLIINGDRIIKEGIDEQGRSLAVREKAWYRIVKEKGYEQIPYIYSFEPFEMERLDAKNIYEYELSYEEKKEVLKKIVDSLKLLHKLDNCETDYFSIEEAYVTKTFKRLESIRDMIPFADEKYITINGRKCRNVYYIKDEIEQRFAEYKCKNFKLLHGDCTFSNMMLKDGTEPVLIDPRGYFGYTEMCGDVAYDWAKLYYSVVGNYDQFNRKNFRLNIDENSVKLTIVSNGWEELEDYFFELLGEEADKKDIKLIHAIIWLSLTTYAWEDYDSICGAFYNGLYYLEECL